ncbi:MAG: hypothetical protein C0425_06460 [Chlorobiaceae bacterium]|nr:hypothetical protein [Chlorobiaceae bacterium]MBA4309962.1 hypothetical protein [Chlorobiaceae bacterium]
MFGYDNFSVHFNINWFWLISLVALIGVYTFFIYKYTIPIVSKSFKFLLIFFRAIALLLILFLIFDPKINFERAISLKPVNIVLIDNSKSMNINEGFNRIEITNKFLDELEQNNLTANSEFYIFGKEIKSISKDSLAKITFSETRTNLFNTFSSLDKFEKNISSIILLSDGVITDGSTPLYLADNMTAPIFTIGLGDSSKRNDVSISTIFYNEIIYAGTTTTISASILNKGYSGKQIRASLFEENILVENKIFTLEQNFQNVEFTYEPKSKGEKKLSIQVEELAGEFSKENNNKSFFIDVLSNKIKVLLVGGTPSTDLVFIKNSLALDTNIVVDQIVQIAPNRFLNNSFSKKAIDSADIIFLIHFPTAVASDELLDLIKNEIENNSKPFFILVGSSLDIQKFNYLRSEMPFEISNQNFGISEVQPNVSSEQAANPMMKAGTVTEWNSLPPTLRPNFNFIPKPETQVLASLKINNVLINSPLIVSRKLGSKRSVAVLSSDIWKWKLQKAPSRLELFDNFILNSVKWLNASVEKEQVSIRTSQKFYSLGESVEFFADVFDESFNAIANAEVKVRVKSKNVEDEIFLTHIGNGIYRGIYNPRTPGDFSFSGSAVYLNNEIGRDEGRFNIGDVEIELIDKTLNSELMLQLASLSEGKFFYNDQYSEIFEIVKSLNQKGVKEKIESKEIYLSRNEWILFFIILFFSLEWFLRKREGML